MGYTIKHTGEGNFEATIDETGEIKVGGPNSRGMIGYTYFEDN